MPYGRFKLFDHILCTLPDALIIYDLMIKDDNLDLSLYECIVSKDL